MPVAAPKEEQRWSSDGAAKEEQRSLLRRRTNSQVGSLQSRQRSSDVGAPLRRQPSRRSGAPHPPFSRRPAAAAPAAAPAERRIAAMLEAMSPAAAPAELGRDAALDSRCSDAMLPWTAGARTGMAGVYLPLVRDKLPGRRTSVMERVEGAVRTGFVRPQPGRTANRPTWAAGQECVGGMVFGTLIPAT